MNIKQEFRDFLREASIEVEFNKKLSQLIKAYSKIKNKYVVIKNNKPGSTLVLVNMNDTNYTTASLINDELRYKQVSLWGKDITGKNDITIHSVKFLDTLIESIKAKNFIDK